MAAGRTDPMAGGASEYTYQGTTPRGVGGRLSVAAGLPRERKLQGFFSLDGLTDNQILRILVGQTKIAYFELKNKNEV